MRPDIPLEPIGPGDLKWDWTGDIRSMITIPGMLIMQEFHPTVADGTGEHSIFDTDPWGRVGMFVTSTLKRTYDAPGAIAESERLWELHKSFTGVGRDGKRYAALNPDAYGFVHATGFVWLLTTAEHYATPLTESQQRTAYAEHLRSGRILGLRDAHMPPTLDDFRVYWADQLDRLEDNPTLHRLFDTFAGPPPPPRTPGFLHPAWGPVGPLLGRFGGLLMRGYLPPPAREAARLPWSDRDQRRYDRIRATVRRLVAALPVERRYVPPARRARAAARVRTAQV